VTWAHTPTGSRLIEEVCPSMYSPAALPSSSRAAPAKKRSWSTIGTSSSLLVSPSGLPVFLDSTAANSSARASTASASFSRASCRTAGVERRQSLKAAAAVRSACSTSSALETGAWAITCSVTGSMISLVLPPTVSTGLPPTMLRRTRGSIQLS
jgi:hypothetical protein